MRGACPFSGLRNGLGQNPNPFLNPLKGLRMYQVNLLIGHARWRQHLGNLDHRAIQGNP